MAEKWRSDGVKVIEMYGIDTFVPADICFVHIDLSVVPKKYLDYANQYAVVINGNVSDIRKSQISSNLISKGENYDGKVIVKSDLNFGGWPEKLITKNSLTILFLKGIRLFGNPSDYILSQEDYKIYDSPSEVPDENFSNSSYIVEKFLPERQGDNYCLNYFKFFGSFYQCQKLYSLSPIVSGANAFKREEIDPHPDIIKIKDKLGMDYGKLDYCVAEGKVILLDANKTTGIARGIHNPLFLKFLNLAAAELYSYLK
jgi:hypothetical protein